MHRLRDLGVGQALPFGRLPWAGCHRLLHSCYTLRDQPKDQHIMKATTN